MFVADLIETLVAAARCDGLDHRNAFVGKCLGML